MFGQTERIDCECKQERHNAVWFNQRISLRENILTLCFLTWKLNPHWRCDEEWKNSEFYWQCKHFLHAHLSQGILMNSRYWLTYEYMKKLLSHLGFHLTDAVESAFIQTDHICIFTFGYAFLVNRAVWTEEPILWFPLMKICWVRWRRWHEIINRWSWRFNWPQITITIYVLLIKIMATVLNKKSHKLR